MRDRAHATANTFHDFLNQMEADNFDADFIADLRHAANQITAPLEDDELEVSYRQGISDVLEERINGGKRVKDFRTYREIFELKTQPEVAKLQAVERRFGPAVDGDSEMVDADAQAQGQAHSAPQTTLTLDFVMPDAASEKMLSIANECSLELDGLVYEIEALEDELMSDLDDAEQVRSYNQSPSPFPPPPRLPNLTQY